MSVTLERHGDALVAAKRSTDRGRLAHEAEVLAGMQHPGLIEHVEFVDGDTAVLFTAWAGTDTLDRRTPSTAEEAIAAIAAISSTLLDMHDAGLSHRALSPQHVIIANDGRPILCGLGSSGPADLEGRAADLAGLKALVTHLAGAMPQAEVEPLRSLALRLERPGASLIDARHTVIPTKSKSHSAGSRSVRNRSIIAAAGAASAAALIVAAAPALLGSSGGETATNHATADVAVLRTDPSIDAASTTTVTSQPMSHPSLPTTFATSPPRSSDDPVAVRVPNVVEHGGRRYGIGVPGDVIVVGDWDCDGEATPAILQTTTGRVAVFSGWPDAAGTLLPSFNGISIDATSLMADHLDSCDILRAVGPYGSTIITEGNP